MALDLGIFLEGSQSTFKVKVSENDAQAQFLLDKLTSSDGSVTITETNDGGIETIDLVAGGGSPLTTKGDLFTYDTSDARLGVGADGQALLADSAEATGLKWGTVSADNMANANLTLDANRTHDLAGFGLIFDNGQVTFEGQNTSSSQTAILVQNSIGSQLLKIDNAGGFALGSGATYLEYKNVSIGDGATATGINGAISIGRNSSATGSAATAVGYLASANGIYSTAYGYYTDANPNGATAIGYNATVTSQYGTAVGYGITSGGAALGKSITCSSNSVAIGNGPNVAFSNSIGIGTTVSVSGLYASAIGYQSKSAAYAVAYGFLSDAGSWGTAIGSSTKTTGSYATAIGGRSTATANYSTIIAASAATRTNSVANSFAVNCNSTDHLFFVGNTVDGWLNSTGNFVFGNNTVAGSAKLAVDSTTSGFLPPRMTTTEKNAIVAPASGLMVYDTTLNKLCVYTVAAWETITSV
jgi:hypothetical protein